MQKTSAATMKLIAGETWGLFLLVQIAYARVAFDQSITTNPSYTPAFMYGIILGVAVLSAVSSVAVDLVRLNPHSVMAQVKRLKPGRRALGWAAAGRRPGSVTLGRLIFCYAEAHAPGVYACVIGILGGPSYLKTVCIGLAVLALLYFLARMPYHFRLMALEVDASLNLPE